MQKMLSAVILLVISGVALAQDIKLTILYDNTVYKSGLQSDWGFSCLVQSPEGTILFDTGTRPHTLIDNIEMLSVDISQIDDIVISHNHRDHVGGLESILSVNHDVNVWFPRDFPNIFRKNVSDHGAETVAVDGPVKIYQHVWTTGQLGESIIEQSLILDTRKGLVIITGCSHPGIINIIEKAQEVLNKPVYLVLGGFHLVSHTDKQITAIIDRMKELGVQNCGATHCTGVDAIKMIKKAFGDHFVEMGVGRIIEFSFE